MTRPAERPRPSRVRAAAGASAAGAVGTTAAVAAADKASDKPAGSEQAAPAAASSSDDWDAEPAPVADQPAAAASSGDDWDAEPPALDDKPAASTETTPAAPAVASPAVAPRSVEQVGDRPAAVVRERAERLLQQGEQLVGRFLQLLGDDELVGAVLALPHVGDVGLGQRLRQLGPLLDAAGLREVAREPVGLGPSGLALVARLAAPLLSTHSQRLHRYCRT